MNAIELLRAYIKQNYAAAKVELTRPLRSTGTWSLDVDFDKKKLAIEWRDRLGFGLTSVDPENFGEHADESFKSLDEVQKRVSQLLTTSENTSPPRDVLLSRLREKRGITQKDVADKLGVRQATVSGIERRNDVQVSTLRRYLRAIGGRLQLFATFPDAQYRIDIQGNDHNELFNPNDETVVRATRTFTQTDYKEIFVGLSEAGSLDHATEVAQHISQSGHVIEFPA